MNAVMESHTMVWVRENTQATIRKEMMKAVNLYHSMSLVKYSHKN